MQDFTNMNAVAKLLGYKTEQPIECSERCEGCHPMSCPVFFKCEANLRKGGAIEGTDADQKSFYRLINFRSRGGG